MGSSYTILNGFFWSFGERILAQLVSIIVSIILARILAPADYGIISIVMVFISICNIFVTSGFGTALVRKNEVCKIDYDTAFVISLAISIILYFLLSLVAPLIAEFYSIELLTPIIKVLSFKIIISSFNNVQQAYIQRNMMFKIFFIATLYGTVISCFIGVAMALLGFGVWALVAQYLTNSFIDTIVLFFKSDWKPKFQFSLTSATSIFSFGWKILFSSLFFTISNELRSLIVGKVFGTAELALYDQGKKYPAVLVDNINVAISKVMLPTFSSVQNDSQKFKIYLRKSIRLGIYVVAPIMLGFAATSESFVILLLTEKWMPAVPFIKIMCFAYLTRPLEELCHRAILAKGRSDVALKNMVIINFFSIFLTIIGAFIFKNIYLIAVFYLVHTLVSLMVFMKETNLLIGYSILEQLSDILPSIMMSFLMYIAVTTLNIFNLVTPLLLCMQILLGISIYLIISCLFKSKQFYYIKNLFNKFSRS